MTVIWYKIKCKQTHLFCWDEKKLIVSVFDKSSSCDKHWLTFSSWDMKNFLQTTQTHQLSASIANLLRRTRAVCVMNRWSQACWCFSWTLSAIRLALYKDTPIPTVAIIMAMGLMRLLCGCICTSPETCLCMRWRRLMRSKSELELKVTLFIILMWLWQLFEAPRRHFVQHNAGTTRFLWCFLSFFHAACYATWAVSTVCMEQII